MRDKQLIYGLVVAAIVLVLLNLPASIAEGMKSFVREAVAPLQEIVSGAWSSVREGASNVRGYGGLVTENKRLSEKAAELEARVRQLQGLEQQNVSLRAQLGFKRTQSLPLIACAIIGRDPDGWWHTLRINKGSADGVSTNLAVISVDGLIGRTLLVTPHTADVLLLSDPTCQVSARIGRTGAFGVLTGRGPNWQGQVVSRLDYINKSVDIVEGDEVITSGLGGVFPPGLLVGQVDRVYTDRSGLYQYADIVSKASIGQLEYVFVVRTPLEGVPP